jgi:alkyl sulfatase BDS1-like metallo-beta-lactamase superfamily hydrolase
VLIVFRDALLFGNRRLKRIIRTVREDCHNSIAHVFNNKPLEGSDDQTDNGFIGKPDTLTIKNAQGLPVWDLESYKAYISLDKPAVRDANDTVMKKQSQCKIWQAGNERRILKWNHLCEHV